jgi:anti-sigma factor ChrR (cupin superfamily)
MERQCHETCFGLHSQSSSPVVPLFPAISHALLDGIDLSDPAEWAPRVPWQPFQAGVEIYRLYGDGVTGPSAALLRFSAGGKIPLHVHTGYEHIIVLAGSQMDENGQILLAGGLRIHPPGSSHSVTSEPGCIVLAIYEKPVFFPQERQEAVSGASENGG